MTDLAILSLAELHDLVTRAQRELAERQKQERRHVMAEIRALADSVGLTVNFLEEEKSSGSLKGRKVAPKYRNPHNYEDTWTGRGMKPRWLAELVEQGREIDEFRI
jgi:DNA-binding protein H-NS